MDDLTRTLRTCAFCPNTCRHHAPASIAVLPESHTPSALCVVALAVRHGRLACDAPTRALLARRDFVHAVQPSCLHHLDIAASLDAVLASSPAPSP